MWQRKRFTRYTILCDHIINRIKTRGKSAECGDIFFFFFFPQTTASVIFEFKYGHFRGKEKKKGVLQHPRVLLLLLWYWLRF